MKVKFVCGTNGRGLWSDIKKKIRIVRICTCYINDDEDFGELQAVFHLKDWDIKKYGLIYTDPLWLKEFKECLISIGFTKVAARDVSYSEQGMQGDDYVSMDVGKKFLEESKRIFANKL
jgi:hypothetical protein